MLRKIFITSHNIRKTLLSYFLILLSVVLITVIPAFAFVAKPMQESPKLLEHGIPAFAVIFMPELAQRSMKILYSNLPKVDNLRKVI